MAKPDQNNAIESSIGLTVATAVESVRVGLAGGCGYRIYPAQRGEGGLGVEAFRVAPCGDQKGRRRVRSYAEDTDQGRRCRPGESFQLRLQILDLLAKLMVATCKGSESVLCGRCGIVHTAWTETLAPCGEGSNGETVEGFAQLGWEPGQVIENRARVYGIPG